MTLSRAPHGVGDAHADKNKAPEALSVRETIGAALRAPENIVLEKLTEEMELFLEKLKEGKVTPDEWQHDGDYIQRLRRGQLTEDDLHYFFSRKKAGALLPHELSYFQQGEAVRSESYCLPPDSPESDFALHDSALLKWAKAQSAQTVADMDSVHASNTDYSTLFNDLMFGYEEHLPVAASVAGRFFLSRKAKEQKAFLYFQRHGEDLPKPMMCLEDQKVNAKSIATFGGHYYAYKIHPKGNDEAWIQFCSVDGTRNITLSYPATVISSMQFGPDGKLYFSGYPDTSGTDSKSRKESEEHLFCYDPDSGQQQQLFNLLTDEDISGHHEWSEWKFHDDGTGSHFFQQIKGRTYDRIGKHYFAQFNTTKSLSEDSLILAFDLDQKVEFTIHQGYIYAIVGENQFYRRPLQGFKTVRSMGDLNEWEKIPLSPSLKIRELKEIKEGYLFVKADMGGEACFYLFSLKNPQEQHQINADDILLEQGSEKIFIHPQGNPLLPGSFRHVYREFQNMTDLSGQLSVVNDVVKENEGIVMKETFVTSEDGKQIPVCMIGNKSAVEKSKKGKVFMYVYGGFNLGVSDTFRVLRELPCFMAQNEDVLFVIPTLRGDYNPHDPLWYEQGCGNGKSLTISDAQQVAAWLIEEGYGEKGKIAIGGISNGSLVATAANLKHPDIFGMAVGLSGPLDIENYGNLTPKMTQNRPEFGDEEALKNLSPARGISHHPERPILVFSGLKDDRVNPFHAVRFALLAAQAASKGGRRSGVRLLLDEHGSHIANSREAQLNRIVNYARCFMYVTHLNSQANI